MNDGLKQRIVGALVLVALGVIFIPVIFDRERIVPVDRESQIPPQPERDILALPAAPEAPRPRAAAISQPIDGQFDIEESRDANASDEAVVKPKVETKDSAAISPAWVLQLASFESKARAEDMLKEVESLDYRGFVRKVNTKKGARIRVFVGPNVDKEQLQRAKIELDQHFKVNALIVRFRP